MTDVLVLSSLDPLLSWQWNVSQLWWCRLIPIIMVIMMVMKADPLTLVDRIGLIPCGGNIQVTRSGRSCSGSLALSFLSWHKSEKNSTSFRSCTNYIMMWLTVSHLTMTSRGVKSTLRRSIMNSWNSKIGDICDSGFMYEAIGWHYTNICICMHIVRYYIISTFRLTLLTFEAAFVDLFSGFVAHFHSCKTQEQGI